MPLKDLPISSPADNKELLSRRTDLVLVLAPPFLIETPHLGLAYLSSYIRAHGFSVTVLDLNVRLFNATSAKNKDLWNISTMNSYTSERMCEELKEIFAEEISIFIKEVTALRALCIGFSVTTLNLCFSKLLAHHIQSMDPESLIVFGGPGVYAHPEKVDREHRIDMYVIGEGEKPLLEIVRRYKSNQSRQSLQNIRGTVLRCGLDYLKTEPQDYIGDLDEIGFPRFEEFDFTQYSSVIQKKTLPVLFSRGCINRCRFCSDWRLNSPYRFRSAENVFEELLYHKQRYGVTFFKANDLLCNGNMRELEKLCDLLIERQIGVQWASYAAIRKGFTPELLRKMKKAGCIYLCYGLESASDHVLKAMNKRYTVRLAQEVIRNTYEANIITAINIIVGFPGERHRDFRQTLKFVTNNFMYISEITNVSTYMFMSATDIDDDPRGCGVRTPLTMATLKSLVAGHRPDIRLSSFWAIHWNTPKVRARRLRRMMRLIYRLGTTNAIINYATEHDPGFECFLSKLRLKHLGKVRYQMRVGVCLENAFWAFSLKAPNKKSDAALKKRGYFGLFFAKMTQVTRQMGFNTSFCLNGHWVDSTFADWEVLKTGDMVRVSVRWSEYRVSQEWSFSLAGRSLCWRVKTVKGEKDEISLIKAGIFISDRYSHLIRQGKEPLRLAAFTDEWQDCAFTELKPLQFVATNDLTERSPLEISFSSNRKATSQVQVTPRDLCARMVNICYDPSTEREAIPIMTDKNPLVFDLYIRKAAKDINKKYGRSSHG